MTDAIQFAVKKYSDDFYVVAEIADKSFGLGPFPSFAIADKECRECIDVMFGSKSMVVCQKQQVH